MSHYLNNWISLPFWVYHLTKFHEVVFEVGFLNGIFSGGQISLRKVDTEELACLKSKLCW